MFIDVVSQTLWPDVDAVRELQVPIVTITAHSARGIARYTLGGYCARTEIAAGYVPLIFVPIGIDKVCWVRHVRTAIAVPVSDPNELHRISQTRVLSRDRLGHRGVEGLPQSCRMVHPGPAFGATNLGWDASDKDL